mgnify:CR=1 FL=1
MIYLAALYFNVDIHGAFSTAKTVALDSIGKLFPQASGYFENIDSQIDSKIVKSGTANSIQAETKKAIEKTSTFLAKGLLRIKKVFRAQDIDRTVMQLLKNAHAKNPAPAYSFDYKNISVHEVSALRQQLITYSMTLRGTPYVWGGKNPTQGFDCSGFVQYATKNGIGVQLPGNAKGQYDSTIRISAAEREPGDLVFFRRFGRIDHVGIYLGKYEGSGSLTGREIFINAASEGPRTGVVVSALDEPYWRRHYSSSARFLPSSTEVAQSMAEHTDAK